MVAFRNPIEVFFGGLRNPWILGIFVIALIAWVWSIDYRMKRDGGEGLFENLFEGLW